MPLEDLLSRAESDRKVQDEAVPVFFSLATPDGRAALERAFAEERVAFVHDTLAAQLGELVETRNPDRKLPPAEIAERAKAHAGADLSRYGSWVLFPWSKRLVHILPESEYEELRTSRNRNKITRAEQDALRRLRVGVAGLSVGQSTAVTLALEGVGGHFRLADFDTLSLSNMNRLRAGAHEIGVMKTSLVAREIYEINPYVTIEVFPRGIVDDTLPAFFGTDEPLDLLFEECDDLKMKVLLRTEARARKIPVLMETSDRGLFDVERFDREPSRALFHGLVGDLDPEKLVGMSTYEKVPIVLGIIGAKTMSRRMAASLVDIDATLKTWPQLASAVALGGAINTDAARRIALGKFQGSGRYFVDIEKIVSDGRAEELAGLDDEMAVESSTIIERPPPTMQSSVETSIPLPQLDRLVTFAALAPSGGNCQPWSFRFRGDVLECVHDVARSKTLLDFDHRASYVAFGALAENLRLGAGALGVGAQLHPFRSRPDPLVLVSATIGGEGASLSETDAALAAQIPIRLTNRRLAKREPVSDADLEAMRAVVREAGAELRFVTEPAVLDELGRVIGLGERLRLMSPVMHKEMMGELRWTDESTKRTRTGLDLATLELTPTDEAGMRLIADPSVMSAVREVEGGHGLAEPSRKSIAAASAVGLVSFPRVAGDAVDEAYFKGGIALERAWLMASAKGLAFQPMTPLLYLFARLREGGEGLDEREKRELTALRTRFERAFGLEPSTRTAEIMLFRLAVAGPPSARSLRRRVQDMLEIA